MGLFKADDKAKRDVRYVFSIYDTVAMRFGPPFVAVNDGVALREFRNQSLKEKIENIGEYKLFHLCEYDEYDGSFKEQDQYEVIWDSKE